MPGGQKSKNIATSVQDILLYWRGGLSEEIIVDNRVVPQGYEKKEDASSLRVEEEGLDPTKKWEIFHRYVSDSKTGSYIDTSTGDVHYIDECYMGADASEFHSRCWRCGCEWGHHGAGRLERCHLIPRQFEDKYTLSDNINDPCNIVLLCKNCHAEAPDTLNPKDTFDWIRETCGLAYNKFWDNRFNAEFIRRSGRANEISALIFFAYLMKNEVKIEPSFEAMIKIYKEEFPEFMEEFKESERKFCGEGLGVHFWCFSSENNYILSKRRELFWLDVIKKLRKTISKTQAELIRKKWSSCLKRITNKDLENSFEAALMAMSQGSSLAPNILENPTLPSLLPQVKKILQGFCR
jgi:hypothetical protein